MLYSNSLSKGIGRPSLPMVVQVTLLPGKPIFPPHFFKDQINTSWYTIRLKPLTGNLKENKTKTRKNQELETMWVGVDHIEKWFYIIFGHSPNWTNLNDNCNVWNLFFSSSELVGWISEANEFHNFMRIGTGRPGHSNQFSNQSKQNYIVLTLIEKEIQNDCYPEPTLMQKNETSREFEKRWYFHTFPHKQAHG